MKNKKIWLALLVSFVVLIAVGVSTYYFLNQNKEAEAVEEQKEEKKTFEVKPLLYKVTKNDSENVMYLFGSIHVADDQAYPMKKEVMEAYDASDFLAVEFDVVAYQANLQAQAEDLKYLMCDPGKTLKDYLSEKTYDKVIKYLKDNNMYNSLYENYKPVLIYSLVTNVANTKSGLDSNKGIDLHFLNKAHNEKKEILEVESSSFQYQLLSGFSNEFYDYLISNTITFEPVMVANVKALYEAWLMGDADKLGSTYDSDPIEEGQEPKSLLDEYALYNDRLINKRNKSMFATVENYFKDNKKVFVVVGAGHIIGKSGIAESFKNAGYNVEQIKYK